MTYGNEIVGLFTVYDVVPEKMPINVVRYIDAKSDSSFWVAAHYLPFILSTLRTAIYKKDADMALLIVRNANFCVQVVFIDEPMLLSDAIIHIRSYELVRLVMTNSKGSSLRPYGHELLIMTLLCADRQNVSSVEIAHYIKILCQYGADLHAKRGFKNAVMIAAELGNKEVLDVLKQAGMDLSLQGRHTESIMDIAMREGHDHIIWAYVDEVAFSDPAQALFHAIKYTKIDIIRFLLDHYRIDINDFYQDKTPLMSAVEYAYRNDTKTTEIVSFLLGQQNMNIFIKNRFGKTALHIAAITGKHFMMIKLIQLGADLLDKDCDNQTPLHILINTYHDTFPIRGIVYAVVGVYKENLAFEQLDIQTRILIDHLNGSMEESHQIILPSQNDNYYEHRKMSIFSTDSDETIQKVGQNSEDFLDQINVFDHFL